MVKSIDFFSCKETSFRGQGGDLAVRRTCHSCRGPRFGSNHPHVCLITFICTSSSWGSDTLSWPLRAVHAYGVDIHAGKTPTYVGKYFVWYKRSFYL